MINSPAYGQVSFNSKQILLLKSLRLPKDQKPNDLGNQYLTNKKVIHLGKLLFSSQLLSKNGKISCASCHDIKRSYTDGRQVSKGLGLTSRNSPTLISLSNQKWFMWDGKADSIWSQALMPLLSPLEMGSDIKIILAAFKKDPKLRRAYERAFPQYPLPSHSNLKPIPRKSLLVRLAKAIASFESNIKVLDSRFDLFIDELEKNGESQQLTLEEQKGLALFIGKAACINCHHGPFFSDQEFHFIGLPQKDHMYLDQGRLAAIDELKNSEFNSASTYSDQTNSQKIRHLRAKADDFAAFKTPTLRNLTLTAPYMHDGRFDTIEQVIHHYSEKQKSPEFAHPSPLLKPLHLSKNQQKSLIAFLSCLKSEIKSP